MSRPTLVPLRRAALAALASAAALAPAGCSADAPRTALAIRSAEMKPGGLRVTTECATDLEVESGPDHGGSDLLEITVWGRPRMGRCHPSVLVEVPPDQTTFVDGTTSTVVDVG